MADAAMIHEQALVVDALVYHGDGDTADLRAGAVNALNMTVCHFEADFAEACDQIAAWLDRLATPNAPWRRIETTADFETARANDQVGLIMGWQNSRPIADKLQRLHLFRSLGLRIMQLTYNYQNFLGCGCLETEDSGLTSFGGDAVRLMNDLGIAIDLSHVGERTAMAAIRASDKPVLLTHANAKAVTDLARNKSDGLIRAVADAGGFIGASIYGPMCWDGDPGQRPGIDDYIRHLEHIVEIAGIEHVGFGTDLAAGADLARIAFERETPRRWQGINDFTDAFGGDIPQRYLAGCNNHRDLPKVTATLATGGWKAEDIEAYLGGNFKRVLSEIWG